MNLFRKIAGRSLGILAVLFIASTLHAQEAKTPPTHETAGSNFLLTALILTASVLAFVIWGIGQVVVTLARQVTEKQKAGNKLPVVILLAGLFLLSGTAKGQDTGTAAAITSYYGGLSSGAFWSYVLVITVEIAVIFFLLVFIKRLQAELMPPKAKKKHSLFAWWSKMDKKIFTRAMPVEKEADVLLDHDYDGIRELDNSLPPWWKYGFYITIGIAIIYLFNFHVLGYGKNPDEEYIAELEDARIKKEQYELRNKDKIDEKNVPMADAAGISAGKEIFSNTCFPCHGKLGEGGAGPNLTDEYWLHKGSLNDIYLSIRNGYPDKGMQAWSMNYSPKEISFLASYIRSIKGSNPPGAKAPQGDLFTEENPAADSVVTAKLPVKQ